MDSASELVLMQVGVPSGDPVQWNQWMVPPKKQPEFDSVTV